MIDDLWSSWSEDWEAMVDIVVLFAVIPVFTVLGVLMIVVLFWVEMRRMTSASELGATSAWAGEYSQRESRTAPGFRDVPRVWRT